MQDISFKVQGAHNMSQRTAIHPESPWKLQQVQDAANHLQRAIYHIDDVDSAYRFKYAKLAFKLLYLLTVSIQYQFLNIQVIR